MRFIGITGGVGSGKSELLAYIGKHYKCEIYRADEVAHLLQSPGMDCWRQLRDLLGEELLLPDGTLDKGKMAERIFADPGLRERVNGIVHPAVQEYLEERVQAARENSKTELLFVEAALLIEAGYKRKADELWYVYAREEVRRRRLAESRGYSEEKIDRIMASQLPEEVFRRECDFVIDNSGELDESYRQIDRRLAAYTRTDKAGQTGEQTL